jgi:hypothetical protein
MDEQALRTTIRGLMASGALPTGPYAGMTLMESGHAAIPDEQCTVCQEHGPQVSYTYRDRGVVRLHAACDSLWRTECPAP